MFQDMNQFFNQSMEPFRKLVEIQGQMLEELAKQQMACTQACIDVTSKQNEALQQCKTPQDMIALQQNYAKELEQTLRHAGEQNLAAMQRAHQALQELGTGTLDAFNRQKG